MALTGNSVYYPLTAGNKWTYKMKDGNTYVNSIESVSSTSPDEFILKNSSTNAETIVRKEGNNYITNSYEAGKFNLFLKDDLSTGETWEVHFIANNFDNILVMTVKEFGSSKEVEGVTFNDVVLIESESKMNMNGNLIPLNYFTQYYYAKGVGLVLTTTSVGDSHSLTSYVIG